VEGEESSGCEWKERLRKQVAKGVAINKSILINEKNKEKQLFSRNLLQTLNCSDY
jgi:hypothetical protein